MAAEEGIRSLLVADCGTVLTKVVLLDRVEGAYRFVAQGAALTTADAPWHDVILGVQHAIEQVEEVTGRELLDDQGSLISPESADGRGVDAFVATVSAPRPLRVVLAGLVRDLSLASAERAASGTYSEVVGLITRDPKVGWMSEQEQVGLILERRPDVVCIVGGTDGGATQPVLELVSAAVLACSMLEEKDRPIIVYAGNKALREHVVKAVGGLTQVRCADNVRPEPDEESLEGVRAELESLYGVRRVEPLAGGEWLQRWSMVPPISTANAFAQLMRYVWYLDESSKGTLGVDLGAAHTTVVGVFGGAASLSIAAGRGLAFGGVDLLRRSEEAVLRWLPVAMGADEARGLLLEKEARPWTVPETPEELWLEQAVARELIRAAVQAASAGWQVDGAQPYPHLTPLLDPILLSGGALAGAPRPGQVALVALDAIEPIGISTLLLDAHGLAAALGGAAYLKPLAAVEALDGGGIVNLGTVVAPVGRAREGEVVLRVRIQYESGSSLELEVAYGALEVLPLPPGEEAVLELRPRAGIDVGLGRPGRGGRRRVSGGLVGLIIDARGRPLQLPEDPEARRAKVQQWYWDVGG